MREYDSLTDFLESVKPPRLLAFSTRGTRTFAELAFEADDALLFGPETRGLPRDVLNGLPPEHRLRIPMRSGNRSMNLSNAVAIAVYEAWRQHNFIGAGNPSI